MFNTVRSRLLKLNLYESFSTDPVVHHREIRSTRLYLLSLSLFILILVTYTFLLLRLKSGTVEQPSLDQYDQLEQLYPNTLSCTCTKISILYHEFATLTPHFHQVCASEFISQTWIDFTFGNDRASLWPMDVRTSLSSMWQLIGALCQQSQVIVGMSVDDFQLSPLISSTLFSRRLLDSKMQAAISNLRQAASDRLIRPLQTTHQLTLINDFLTGISTNHIVRAAQSNNRDDPSVAIVFSTQYLSTNSTKRCHCQSEGSCPVAGGLYSSEASDTLGLYDLNTIVADQILPGLIVDCLPIQMMFASTLECFYNRSCVDLLISSYSSTLDITILNVSVPSRFPMDTPIEKVIDDLFIETMVNQTDYGAYYEACAPSLCTYTYARRFDWLFTITTLMSLFGGLNVALRLIVPYVIVLFDYIRRNKTRQPGVSLKIRMGRVIEKGLRRAQEFNLYTQKSRNPLKIHRGRLSSRLFFTLFAIVLATFIIYTSLLVQTFHESVASPTRNQYLDLYNKYPDTLDCPCSTISVSYQDIMQIQPTYHQLCASSYVQPWWYRSLTAYGVDSILSGPFFPMMMVLRTMAIFCELGASITTESIRNFYATNFVTSHVISEGRFRRETEVFISDLQNSTKNNFFYTLELIRTVLQANQYISGTVLQNSVLFVADMNMFGSFPLNTFRIISLDVGLNQDDGPSCYCARRRMCDHETTGNFLRSCSLINFVLSRSWGEMYGEEAVDGLREDFSAQNLTLPENTTVLDPTLPSRFALNASFQTILDELTIEDWNPTASFHRFYDKCRPVSCSFTYQARPNFFFVLSITIGLIGGLNQILRLICPLLVRFFFGSSNHDNLHPGNDGVAVRHRCLHRVAQRFRYYVTTLNLFDSETDDVRTKHIEHISTWVYLLLLAVTLSVFTIYTMWDTDISVNRMPVSSFAEYEQLANRSLRHLQCPCTHISVAYKHFLSVNTTFHQVCSSDFVQDSWVDYLFDNSFWFLYPRSDLRVRGAAYFTLLASICNLSHTIVNSSIDQLLNDSLINSYLISEADFRSKAERILDGFIKRTPLIFATALQLINSVTHGNTFASTYFLNWDWEAPTSPFLEQVVAYPMVLEGGCSCATRSDCRAPAGVFYVTEEIALFIVPGFSVGCSSMDTLSSSTLECFYDQHCLDELLFWMTPINGLHGDVSVHPLDATLINRFPSNASLKNMIESLMVEIWQKSMSYAAFYDQCAPSYCTHITEKYDALLTVLIRLLGFYGGLASVLRIAVPFIIKTTTKIAGRRKTVTTIAIN